MGVVTLLSNLESVIAWAMVQKKNMTEAVKLFRKAAEQDCSEGCLYVGYSYLDGDGVEQQYYEATNLFGRQLKKALPRHNYKLGRCYGYGVKENTDEAICLFTLSPEGIV